MTPATLTIAGETIGEEDWPVGCPGFELVGADVNAAWLLRIKHPYFSTHDVFLNHNDREFQDRCRCYFLDKAAEVYRNDPSQGFLTLTEMDEVKKAKSQIARYLASAEKWARIGRAERRVEDEL